MLITDLKSPHTVKRYRSLIPSPYLDDFVSWLENRGHGRNMIMRKLQGAVRFAAWARRQKLGIEQLDQLALIKFRRHLAKRGALRYPSGRYNRAEVNARIFVTFLESRGVVELSSPYPQDDALALVEEFNQWMRTHRGTLDSTLGSYRASVIKLIQAMGTDPKSFNAKGVRNFLLHQVRHSSSGTWRNMTTAIRMFLRFLIIKGDCASTLDQAIPSVARWNLASVPKFLPAEKIEKLINSCDQGDEVESRDRAMLLLMARLGLRASDVSALKIDDFDWSQSTVIVSGKNRHETRLPLQQDVGDAILHYFIHFRREVSSEYLFITTVAPFGQISRQAIRSAVVRSLRRTGIDAPLEGTHLFRHSVATSMLKDGMSLPAIGAILRHASIDTTAVYAKVDFTSLTEVAMPWPEVQTC